MSKPWLRHLVCERCNNSFTAMCSKKRRFCDPCRAVRRVEATVEIHRNNPDIVKGLKRYAAAAKGKPNPYTTGERHYKWKGDGVGIDALHFWVMRHKPDPGYCEHCGVTDVKLEWSNISQEYKRDLDDFQRLCRSCHLKYDNKMGVRNGNQKAVHSGLF